MAPYGLAPIGFERIVAGLRLQAGAEDAVRLLGFGDRLHRGGEVVIGRRYRDAVLLDQVLAVHEDEDRDVEGDAHPLAVDQRRAIDQRLGEVLPVEVRHRQLGIALVEFDGIDAVVREHRHPRLVEIVEIVAAEVALNVPRRLGEHLLERHDLDLDVDAGRIREFLLDLIQHHGRRRCLGGVADGGALVLAANLLQPPGLVVGQPVGVSTFDEAMVADAPPVAAQHSEPEGREPDAGQAHPAQELALGNAPIGIGVCRIDDECLPVVGLEAHCLPPVLALGPGLALSASSFRTQTSGRKPVSQYEQKEVRHADDQPADSPVHMLERVIDQLVGTGAPWLVRRPCPWTTSTSIGS